MGHTKVFLLEEMKTTGETIIALLLQEDVNIKPDHFSFSEDVSILKMDFIRPGYKWLNTVLIEEFEEVKKVKRLLTDKLWKRYKTWGGFEDLREAILLKEALNTLRAKVVSRERPDVLKKSKCTKAIKTRQKAKTSRAAS